MMNEKYEEIKKLRTPIDQTQRVKLDWFQKAAIYKRFGTTREILIGTGY